MLYLLFKLKNGFNDKQKHLKTKILKHFENLLQVAMILNNM